MRKIEMNELLLEMKNKNVSKNFVTQLTFKPCRVFINHVDSYHGKKLTDFLLAKSDYPSKSFSDIMKKSDFNDDNIINNTETNNSILTTTTLKQQETRNYEIIGTVTSNDYQAPKNVHIINENNREILLNELMKCDYIIYDITIDDKQIEEASWSVKAIAEKLENASTLKSYLSDSNTKETHYFMLISNIMTWALTKSLDPENPNAPFTEADYTKRIAHKNFKDHMHCENDVIMIKKRYNLSVKFKTLVLCCGITYGDEENQLNFLFNMAWNNINYLPIFGDGKNIIPLLNIKELTNIVHSLLHCWPEQVRYLVATELDLITQTIIVKKISEAFSNGRTKQLTINELSQFTNITMKDYDVITVNVNIVSGYTLDKCIQSNVTFEMNFNSMINEYRIFRNILPVKIIILGPPAVGKTTLSKCLANYYCITYINVKSLIKETIQRLTIAIEKITTNVNINGIESNNVEFDDIDDEFCEINREKNEIINFISIRLKLLEQLNEIRNNITNNNGRLDDDTFNKLLAKRLMSKECQNHGYIIDGFPKTLQQTQRLFGCLKTYNNMKNVNWTIKNNDKEEINIMPELVIILEASDKYLFERVIHLPEREIQRTHYNVESMLRRLREYRKLNEENNKNPLGFFITNNIQIFIIPIENGCLTVHSLFHKCLEVIGKPRNLGPITLKITTVNSMTTNDEAETRVTSAERNIRREEQLFEKEREHERMMIDWANNLEKIHYEEEKYLQLLSEPLRLYLVNYVFPTLTQGLIEVARLRPNDPVDFLAEFLFKNNPNGKMIELENSNTVVNEQYTSEE